MKPLGKPQEGVKMMRIKSRNSNPHPNPHPNHGTSPDILQLARPNLAGNIKGYMAPKPTLTHVGQRVKADYMFTDFKLILNVRYLFFYKPSVFYYRS